LLALWIINLFLGKQVESCSTSEETGAPHSQEFRLLLDENEFKTQTDWGSGLRFCDSPIEKPGMTISAQMWEIEESKA
jgi:hypothetical protein